MSTVEVVSSVLLGAGAVFAFTGGVGLLRFRDFYSRTHASSITDSAGAGLIMLGLLMQSDWDSGVRLVLIIVFLLFSSPTATHALAQSALRDGQKPKLYKGTGKDKDKAARKK